MLPPVDLFIAYQFCHTQFLMLPASTGRSSSRRVLTSIIITMHVVCYSRIMHNCTSQLLALFAAD
jgi:hypothetical protein